MHDPRVHPSTRRSHRLLWTALLLVACAREPAATETPEPAPLATAAPTTPPATLPEGPLRYRGEVTLPAGPPMELFVELRASGDDGYVGEISIPAQGAFELELGEITVEVGKLSFALVQVGARWSATLASDGQASDCAFEQSGMKLACALEPIDEATLAAVRSPPRPQTPAPPFPYDITDVEYDNETDGVRLAGTLTIPSGPGPFPAALLITGSGAQDRDESLMGHKPFLVLADHLTRQGIAVLRVDDRGVGGSSGVLSESTGEALARDVATSVRHLRGTDRIDPERVGLIGHSEGAILGPRVAADDPKIAFVVMMAGTGVPGYEVIREQSAAILRASGAPETAVELARNQQAQALKTIMDHPSNDDALRELEVVLGTTPPPQVAAMLTPWFRSFLAYDPAPALRKLRCPVLVLDGELDLQVLPDQNLPAIEAALAKNRRRTTVHRLPGLNHLFQHAKTGSPSEYGSIEETLAPEVLQLIGDWVVTQTKPGKRKKTAR